MNDDIRRFLTRKGDQRKQSKQAFRFCFCFRLMFKLKLAVSPPDIIDLFNKYSDNKEVMTMENLRKFLTEFQGEDPGKAEAIFNSVRHYHVFQRRGLRLDAFLMYLLGDLNPPLASLGVHHDMEKPLSHYFLCTGHNSYLTGNQFSSASSIEPIIRALKNGVRVIELDLWPSKEGKHEVKVCHGGTMTSPVKLLRCLEAIKEHAFTVSEYPVIITFEDHLKPRLQKKVAKMVSNTFGDMLYTETNFFDFPSPKDLKRKILISTKPPSASFNDQEKSEQKYRPRSDTGSNNSGEFLNVEIKDNQEEVDEEAVIPKYEHLISIHAVKWKSELELEYLLKEDSKRVARLSLSEERLENAIKSHATAIVRFTQKNLLRVYPKGTRIFSSNYNPMIGWTHGAQMVALNMQGHGKHLWIMQGMFRANGGCGYVKKPDFLLSDEEFDPNIEREVKKTLKVKLYMGDGWHLDFRRTYFDPFSPPDFFTKVQIWGVPADMKKERTVPIEDQWVPMWNQEFKFRLTAPELALLRIEVREDDLDGRHGFGGQTCLPVSELRSGIRAVPLYSKKGDRYEHVRLLMRFQLSP